METGLFEIQAAHLCQHQQSRQLLADSGDVVHTLFQHSHKRTPADSNAVPHFGVKADGSAIEFAHCFLRFANLPNFALDRLSRYEAILWRQACRVLYALETLDRENRRSEAGVFGLERKKTWNNHGRRVPGLKQRPSEVMPKSPEVKGFAGLWVGPVFAQIVPLNAIRMGKTWQLRVKLRQGG